MAANGTLLNEFTLPGLQGAVSQRNQELEAGSSAASNATPQEVGIRVRGAF